MPHKLVDDAGDEVGYEPTANQLISRLWYVEYLRAHRRICSLNLNERADGERCNSSRRCSR